MKGMMKVKLVIALLVVIAVEIFIMFHFRQLTFMQQKPGNLFF